MDIYIHLYICRWIGSVHSRGEERKTDISWGESLFCAGYFTNVISVLPAQKTTVDYRRTFKQLAFLPSPDSEIQGLLR